MARASACSGELQFAVVHPEAAIGAKLPAEAGSSTLKRAPHRFNDNIGSMTPAAVSPVV